MALVCSLTAGRAAVQPGTGGVTFYTDQPSFQNAAGPLLTFGFSGVVANNASTGAYANQSGFTRDGVNFQGATQNGYFLGIEGPDFYSSADYNHGLNEPTLQGPAVTSTFYNITNGQTVINFSSPVTAFGLTVFDVLTGDSTGAGTDTVRLNVAGANGSVVTPAYSGAAFLGFTSAAAVTSVTLTGTTADEFPTIADIRVSSTATIATTGGDIAANVYSLGSLAAQTSPVTFNGGTLRMTGGSFADNVIPSPVTLSSSGGTVDTSTGSGGFSGTVSGGGTLTVIGGNTFTLSGSNTYSGGTLINGATLAVATDGALGSGPVTINGGTLQAAVGTGVVNTGNAIVIGAAGATFDSAGANSFNLTGGISGANAGTVTFNDSSSNAQPDLFDFVLSGTNTTTASVVVTASTNLQTTSNNALGTGALQDNGTIHVSNNVMTTSQLTGGGSISADGYNIGSNVHGTLVVEAGNFSGRLRDGTSDDKSNNSYSGILTVIKSSDGTSSGGTLVLSGNSNYSGGTQLQAGTIEVAGTSALGTGTLAMSDGTILVERLGAVLANAVTLSGTDTVETADTSGNGLVLNGNVSGTGTLVKTGATGLRLAGNNTYTGGTLLQAGHIGIASNSSLGTGTLTFAGGFLEAHAGGFTVGNAAILQSAGAIDTNGFQLTYAGAISGGGQLTKAGAGTLILTGPNSYTGGTALQAGTLAVGSATALGTGALTFGGGTLQAAADGLTLTNAGVLATGGTVDTQGYTLRFAGALSGSGALTKVGTGTLALAGPTDTYTGATLTQAGTILAGATNAFSPASAVTVAAGARLDLGGFNNAIGSLAGSGEVLNGGTRAATLTTGATGASTTFGGLLADGSAALALAKAGAGTLTLTGANRYSGGTTLRGGTLAIGNGAALGTGPLAMDQNTTLQFLGTGLTLANAVVFTGITDPTIDTGSGSQTISGAITGPGALTKTGTGVLDLTGTSTYTGATTVAEGTLLVDGALTNSAVSVLGGATLGGSGAIPSFALASGATLAPSTAAPLRVSGNASFAPGSTYQVTLNPDGSGSRLAVGGIATLGGAAVSVLRGTGAGTFQPGTTYTILTAGNGVSGTFGALTAATDLALLTPTLSYSANSVGLTLRAVSFPTLATTPNQAAAAGALQALGPNSPLFNAVLGQNQAGARQAFAATSGVTHANAPAIVDSTAQLTTALLLDRLWDLSGNGSSAQQVLDGFAPDRLPALVRCYGPVDTPLPTGSGPRYTAWGEAFGTFGHSDGGLNAGTLDRSLGGFILGIDTPLDGAGLAKWRGGVAVGYTNNSFTSRLDGGTGTLQGVFGSLYGGARYGAVDVRLGTTVGGTFTDARRAVAFPGFFDVEQSASGGATVQTFGEVGYRIPAGTAVIEPVAGAAFLHIHQDGFTEAGGAAALTARAFDNDLGTTTLGFRGEAQPFAAWPVVARGFLAWQHVIGDVSPATTLAFSAAPADTFAVTGTPLDRDALLAEAALDYKLDRAITVGLSYVGQVGATAYDHSVKGRLEYRF